jgi:fibrillarin-like rRNA methylase
LVYRKGKTDPKHYSSCITSIVVVEQIFKDFASFDQFKLLCENRSVFTLSDLKRIYQSSKNNLCVIKFIFCKEFLKRPILR